MAEFTAYLNGEWLPNNECKLAMNDRGFRAGDAVFEVERTFNGKIFDLEGHLDRLYRSLRYVRIDPGLTKDEMAEVSEEVVRRNDHLRGEGSDFTVRQVVTRGPARSVVDKVQPTIHIGVDHVNFRRFAPLYDQGCHVVFTRTRAYHPDSLNPKVKHQSRMNFVLAELEAADIDPEAWPVLLDHEGNISEGTGFNFWVVTNGVLRTAGERNILQGISRNAIMGLAKELDIPVAEEEIQIYDAYTADEAFVSGTSHCLLPVSKLDNRPLGGEIPGPVVRQLLAAWSEKIGVDIIDQMRKQAGIGG